MEIIGRDMSNVGYFILAKEKLLKQYFWFFAIVVVGLSVIGGFISFSPVPYWDMWRGYLNFYMLLRDGDATLWWAQHNEHRIVLARLLFYTDLRWFSGGGWFLVVVNYLLVGLSAFLFLRMLRESIGDGKGGLRDVLYPFLLAWLFLWIQQENLVWGFQSEFILAQLLPLLAFFLLYKSAGTLQVNSHFVGACLAGLASVGTLANGVLALPLMAVLAVLTRQGLIKVTVLSTLSALELYFYFLNYTPISRHGSLTHALASDPIGLAQYVLIYVGGPFYYISGGGNFGKVVAQLSGLFLICVSVLSGYRFLNSARKLTLQAALLLFILYILGTAIGTGGGRLMFGLDQALSYRYTTPSLMAWAALLVCYGGVVISRFDRYPKLTLSVMVVVSTAMLNIQLKALNTTDEILFGRKVASLALELGVRDTVQLNQIYNSPDNVLSIAKRAKQLDLSVFGAPPIRDASVYMDTKLGLRDLPGCNAHVDKLELVEGDLRYLRVAGWLFDPVTNSVPDSVRFIDGSGHVVGIAVSGIARPDVEKIVSSKAIKAGFQGYLKTEQLGQVSYLQAQFSPSCQVQVTLPPL